LWGLVEGQVGFRGPEGQVPQRKFFTKGEEPR
jgi:hypothetical protein